MKITMRDIARVHGISVNAVSLALNNKPGVSSDMRIKILRTAEELGYLDEKSKFADTYVKTTICVMMQKRYYQDMNFYGRVLFGVLEEAKKHGYDTLINYFDDMNFEIPVAVTRRGVAGIIVIGKIKDQNISLLCGTHTPLVLADHASMSMNIDSIVTDNRRGSFVLVKYLLEKGFKKIGFYGELGYSLSIKERFWGYKEALFNFGGFQPGEQFDRYVDRYSILEGTEEAILSNNNKKIVELVKVRQVLPEVFVCSNDKAAISLMVALEILGYQLPGDISVVGFDNIDMCEKIRPKLTTVNVNKEVMGKRAVQRLLYRISHKNSLAENAVISVDLIERESVGEPGV